MRGTMVKRLAMAGAVILSGASVLVMLHSAPASADRAVARATLYNGATPPLAVGEVIFRGHGSHADRVVVSIDLPDGAPGLGAFHGLHVHSVGTCTAPFTSAGGHWNLVPDAKHGNHTGDMPSILVGSDGRASASFETPRFDVSGLFDGDGSAVILHAGVDNFGNVPVETGKYEDPNSWKSAPTGTNSTGDAGARYACGVVQP